MACCTRYLRANLLVLRHLHGHVSNDAAHVSELSHSPHRMHMRHVCLHMHESHCICFEQDEHKSKDIQHAQELHSGDVSAAWSPGSFEKRITFSAASLPFKKSCSCNYCNYHMYPHVLVTLISATCHDLFNMFCLCLAFACQMPQHYMHDVTMGSSPMPSIYMYVFQPECHTHLGISQLCLTALCIIHWVSIWVL